MRDQIITPDNLTQGVNPDNGDSPESRDYSSDRFEGDVSWKITDFQKSVDQIPDRHISGNGFFQEGLWGGVDRE